MSQELVGACGAVVGSEDYFQRINQGTIVAPCMISSSGYQYYSAVGQLGARCVSVLDEIYSDLQSAGALLSELSPERKSNLHQFISNLDEAANFVSPAFTCASGCRSILEQGGSMMSSSIAGIWGTDIGSTSYMQSKCSPIFQSIFADPLASIVQAIVSDLTSVANQISADLDRGISQHHYMTDENGDTIQAAIHELERCNISALRSPEVRKLCWYSGIPQDKVLTLQKALNKIPGFDTLTEDGVYGEKTSNVWNDFYNILIHGSVPTLGFIDPLQTAKTGISMGATKNAAQSGLQNAFVINHHPYFRFDPSHNGRVGMFRDQKLPIDYNHVNLDKLPDANKVYTWMQGRYNHFKISDDAYRVLSHLEKTGKIVRIAGKVLLVAGAALDALEIGATMQQDLNDADGKLGKPTLSAVASIGGSWAGAFAGAKAGALLGALTGPAAPVFVPILSIVGGIGGTIGGRELGEYIVDITCLEG